MAEKGHIFISYATADEDFTRTLERSLREDGLSVWVSYRHENLPGGVDFEKEIETAIEECSVFLLVYSENAKNSSFVKGEWTRFQQNQRNRSLLIIRIEHVALPIPLTYINCLEAWKYRDTAISHLKDQLKYLRIVPETINVDDGNFIMGNSLVPFNMSSNFMKKNSNPPSIQIPIDVNAARDEDPASLIELNTFQIGRYSVSIAQFRPFVNEDGYINSDYWTEMGWDWRDKNNITSPLDWDALEREQSDHPVGGVSWFESVAYCSWLSKRTGKSYRLPTEAEWEKAARGTDGRRWPWGNSWDPMMVHHDKNSPHHPVSVESYTKGQSAYGCIQMAGNVYEWCSSLYLPYPYLENDGREDMQTYNKRVLRGGCWLSNKNQVRCAHRFCAFPEARHASYSLRVALEH